jgi:hypothetical protein
MQLSRPVARQQLATGLDNCILVRHVTLHVAAVARIDHVCRNPTVWHHHTQYDHKELVRSTQVRASMQLFCSRYRALYQVLGRSPYASHKIDTSFMEMRPEKH